jgi:hypothetical protein
LVSKQSADAAFGSLTPIHRGDGAVHHGTDYTVELGYVKTFLVQCNKKLFEIN